MSAADVGADIIIIRFYVKLIIEYRFSLY